MDRASRPAVYAGSFDPPTYGHLDLVERAAKLFDHVIVAVGVHPTRQPLFSAAQRLALLEKLCAPFPNVTVSSFDGLLVNFSRDVGARVIVRGLRVGTDFEYELQLAHANADLCPEVDTVFLPTRATYGFISASLVREIASHGGDVSHYAPPEVCEALRERFAAGE
ncbi:MAG: pantetheine-phosphate adenylyltransferase [Sorangiineae bacterium]|nr:pantetheine-phosphate adenylyltransferase [Polyangiaceae bacterium]MEB2322351.1 pantetheine-phosphate adenylyltransferase [Sorangiineae bacterium]